MKATSLSASELLFPLQYRGKALSLLLLQPQRRLHVREIARLTGTVAGTMNKELDRLQRAGLLEKHRVGNQLQYCANQQHPVFPELSALLRKTIGLADVLALAHRAFDVAATGGGVVIPAVTVIYEATEADKPHHWGTPSFDNGSRDD